MTLDMFSYDIGQGYAYLNIIISCTFFDMSIKSCPSNWISFGSSCYNISAHAHSWDKAAMECLRCGAKLVEIETKEENDFLKQRISRYSDYDSFWIGGTDKIIEGTFVWASNGSSLNFTDWNSMEPNDSKGNEDCVEISRRQRENGMWNDINCVFTFYFICEKSCE